MLFLDGVCEFRAHIELDYTDGCLVKRYKWIVGKTVIENLTSLDQLSVRGATIFALPPKIQGGAEAPLRVTAM